MWKNMFFTLILMESFEGIISDQKCYTNESFISGKPEICGNSLPFCCYDFMSDFYCCEEEQTITIMRNSSTVLGTLFLWTVIIVTICFVFVDFDADRSPPVVVMTEPTLKGSEDDGFSVVFNPQKEEKTIDKETIVETTAPEAPKTENEEKSDYYKPAWGQFDPKTGPKASPSKIGFKQKAPKSVKSVEVLKQSITKSKAEEREKSKTSDKKTFSKNVEKLTKSLNK